MNKPLLLRDRSSQLFPVYLGLGLEQREVYAVLELSSSFQISGNSTSQSRSGILLCLMDIPEIMIPSQILTFFSSALEEVNCFRIFRQYLQGEKYVGLLFLENALVADIFMQHYNQQAFSALFEGVCDLRAVVSVSIQTHQHHIPIEDWRILQMNYNDLDLDAFAAATLSTTTEEEFTQALLMQSTAGRSSQGSPNKSADNLTTNLQSHASTLTTDGSEAQQEMCTLCLEPFSTQAQRSVVLYCGHAFHSRCLMKVENHLCPVCRFQHQHPLHTAPTCLLCTTSSVPNNSANSTTFLSPQKYIAHPNATNNTSAPPGLKSPSMGPMASIPNSSSSSSATTSTTVLYTASELQRDLWLCLVCGITLCGSLCPYNHRLVHYRSHFHAYYLHVFERKVYDCAGGGYVHRLVLQREEEENEEVVFNAINSRINTSLSTISSGHNHATNADNSAMIGMEIGALHATEGLPSMSQLLSLDRCANRSETGAGTANSSGIKVVEVCPPYPFSPSASTSAAAAESVSSVLPPHPQPHQLQRPLHPPLSDADEERLTTVKLETLVQRYNDTLAFRLEATRAQYEAQLQALWRDTPSATTSNPSSNTTALAASKGTTPSSSSSSTTATYWLRQLQGSLTQELVKLTRHNDSLREKCAQLTREAEDACALERQLQENEEVYQQQVRQAEQRVKQAQQVYKAQLLPLQAKVARLMQRLEAKTQFASSTSQHPRMTTTAPHGDDEESEGKDGDQKARDDIARDVDHKSGG